MRGMTPEALRDAVQGQGFQFTWHASLAVMDGAGRFALNWIREGRDSRVWGKKLSRQEAVKLLRTLADQIKGKEP